MSARTQHVVLHEGKWAVKAEGSRRVTVFPTKREAIDEARRIAAETGTDMLIHGRLGQIFHRSEVAGSLDEDTIREAVRKIMDASNPTRSVRRRRSTRGEQRSRD